LTGIKSPAAAARARAATCNVSGAIGQSDASSAMSCGNYSMTGGRWKMKTKGRNRKSEGKN
jgi:hypothetical protein